MIIDFNITTEQSGGGGGLTKAFVVVDTLPTASASTANKIYVMSDDEDDHINGYVTIDNGVEADPRYTWEMLGGGGSNNVVTLTQEDYDDIVDPDPNTTYVISDAEPLNLNNYKDIEQVTELPLIGMPDKLYLYENTLLQYKTNDRDAFQWLGLSQEIGHKYTSPQYTYMIGCLHLLTATTKICDIKLDSSIKATIYYDADDEVIYVYEGTDTTAEPIYTIEHDGTTVVINTTAASWGRDGHIDITWSGVVLEFAWSNTQNLWSFYKFENNLRNSNDINYYVVYPDYAKILRNKYIISGGNGVDGTALKSISVNPDGTIGYTGEPGNNTIIFNGNQSRYYSNGSSGYTFRVYSPETTGTSNQMLLSSGGNTPVWSTQKIVFCTMQTYDDMVSHDSTTLYIITD